MKRKILLLMTAALFGVATVFAQFAGGKGTATEPYLISTPEYLVEINFYLNNTNLHFKMINDIDLTNYLAPGGAGHNGGAGWLPIGNAANKFSGTFDGAGFKITGLWINRENTDYVGLFAQTNGANFSNLGVEIASEGMKGFGGGIIGRASKTTMNNCSVTGGNIDIGGGLCGSINNSTINNCHATVNVGSGGGLVYSAGENSTINDCYATGNVNGSGGGLISNFGSVTISNCYSRGNVGSNNNNFAGGLVGSSYNTNYNTIIITITNSYAEGNVSGDTNVGGLVGYLYCWDGKYTISNCRASGNISGNNRVGGFVGGTDVASLFQTSSITKCYAGGNVIGNSNVGGLVGYSSSRVNITDCYANSNVSGNEYVGGLIGANSSSISRCYATGNVIGNTSVGGFTGRNNTVFIGCSINSSFYDYETTGQMYGIGSGGEGNLAGKPTSEMQKKSTFTEVGWDFTTVWDIHSRGEYSYPFLRNVPEVGINEPIQNINIQIYPNPVLTELFINSDSQIEKVEIYSITGALLKICNNFKEKISVSALARGIYFLKVYTDKGVMVSKFVKE